MLNNNFGILSYEGAMGPYKGPMGQGPWAQGPWVHGLMGPWAHGSTDFWAHGPSHIGPAPMGPVYEGIPALLFVCAALSFPCAAQHAGHHGHHC